MPDARTGLNGVDPLTEPDLTARPARKIDRSPEAVVRRV
jgi:hypothetical protein